MRPIAVMIVVVAVLAAGTTAVLARRWVAVQASHEPAQIAMIDVLVAGRDVPAGAIVQPEDLRFDRWPASSANARLVVRKDGEDVRARFAGQTSRRDLAEGEPVSEQALRRNASGMLAGMLEAGQRAVSVPITNASAVSGFVTPGDRVDVVLSADLVRTKGNDANHGGPMVRYAAETVLADVKVLAVDQTIARARDGGAIEGKTATLAVTPKQAEVLAAAAMLGSLSLALRGADAEPVAAAPAATPFTADTEASRALNALNGARPKPASSGASITINRAGQITAQSVGR